MGLDGLSAAHAIVAADRPQPPRIEPAGPLKSAPSQTGDGWLVPRMGGDPR